MSERVAAVAEPKAAPVAGAPARPSLTPARSARLQRACACGEGAAGTCKECDKEKEKRVLQRASTGGAQPANVPPSVSQTLNNPGRPLENSTRTFMESRFGHDFGGVRIHNDALAAQSARAINASAYTVGQHIAFADGQYQPATPTGDALLAHELAHTIQQAGLSHSQAGMSPLISNESDMSESEAASAAVAVMSGKNVSLSPRPMAPLIHRTPWGDCPAGTKKPLNEDLGKELQKKAVASGAKAAANKQPKAFTQMVAEAAEDYIAPYFKNARGRYAHTNKQPISVEAVRDADENPYQTMVNEAQRYFRSDGSGGLKSKKKSVTSGSGAPTGAIKPPRNRQIPVEPAAFEEGRVEEATVEGPSGTIRKPDFIDFQLSEVYDATTIDAAAPKVNKIQGYIGQLDSIRLNSEFGPISVPAWQAGKTLKAPEKFTFGVQGPSDPLKICFGVTDFDAYAGVLAYQVVDTSGVAGAEGGATIPGEPYDLSIGGQIVTVTALPAPSSTDLLNSGANNKAVAESIPGVILKMLNRKKAGLDTVSAEIETTENSKSAHKSEMPLKASGKKAQVVYNINKQTRKLTLSSKTVSIPIEFEKLSKGHITKLNYTELDGLSGEGTIKPSIPLLSGLNLHFAFAQDSLAVLGKLPGDQLKVPIPGFKVVHAKLSLQLAPVFKPEGEIAFTIGTGKKPLIEGVISVTADAEGFLAKGDLIAHIPGVDEATGKVIYRPASGWSGSLSVTTSQIPFVHSANVTVSFGDAGLDVSGGLEIRLPGDQKVSLGIKKLGHAAVVYSGQGEFNVKRLKPVVISFTYDGKNVSGTVTTGFTFQGLAGDITLSYLNGVVTGTGTLKFEKPAKKPTIKGSLTVNLNKNHKFSGEGTITYEIKPGLVATAGIKIDENEKVTVMGQLTFPPYQLFKKFPDPPKRITIFELPTISIPIPGASIGPIGLQARIDAGIYADYGIGPGEIRGGYVKSTINPLEENMDFDVEVGGQVYIPAFFKVTGSVSGSVALDVKIASVAGGLTVSVSALLNGHVLSNLKAHYFKGKFEAQADFELLLALALSMALTAFVKAEAGVWRFKVTTTKEWKLAEFKFDTGLKLGLKLKKPISYSSETGFAAPSLGDIEWILPKFEPEKAVKESFARDPGTEKEQG